MPWGKGGSLRLLLLIKKKVCKQIRKALAQMILCRLMIPAKPLNLKALNLKAHVESEDALTQVQQGIGGVSDSRCMEEKQSDIDQAGKERSADSDSNGKADEVSRELHSKIRQLAAAESWPNGPDQPHGLFLWPEWNSARLLDVSSMNLKKERVERLLYLLSLDIEIHECYAGTGNGAVTLHRQLDALRMECQKHAVSCVLFQHLDQDATQSLK